MIHIDIWGPYKVPAKGKFKFFLTIVDDFSTTWVYLIQLKSQAWTTLETFINYAKTQFGKQIKIIRSDNALELDDSKAQPHFVRYGIVHQTSCVDRPQQNGKVERKHNHLLEVTRALRFQAGLPLSFWGDCVLAASFSHQ